MFLADKKWIDHPGSFLKEELDARGWLQEDLAYFLGCSVQSINLIVNEKRGISPDMAKALGKAFSVSAEFFSNLQKLYELSQTEEPSSDIEKRVKLQNYPVRNMINRGWIEEADTILMEEQLIRFLEVSDLNELPYLDHAAKKTNYDELLPEQLVWLFRVRQIAKEMVVDKYTKAKAKIMLNKLAALRNEPEQISKVPRLLAECGIRFVIVESLPKANIDGVCTWLDKSSPVIGMSLRFDRIDNFWFVLRHEIEHVIQKHGQEKPIIDVELEGESAGTGDTVPEEERIANLAAGDFCSPRNKMDSFYLRKAPYISERDVLTFASMNDLHPGLVVGQIHNRSKRYTNFRKYLVKIRQYISPNAVVDGWGEVAPVQL